MKKFADGVVVGECDGCGLIYTPRRHPMPEALLSWSNLHTLRVLYRPILKGRHKHFRARNFADYLTRIGRFARGRRLLDVGCAHGFFPAAAREQGYEVTGVEPSPAMADFAEQELKLNILRGRLDEVDLGDAQWDVVSFTDSAEYIPTLMQDLQRVLEHMAPGGILFLKVPNGDYVRLRHWAEQHLGARMGGVEAYSLTMRVAHYALKDLRHLAEKLGLRVLEARACPPIDSSPWRRIVGLGLEIEAPWFFDLRERLLRRFLYRAGLVESRLRPGQDHFSPSIYLIARKK